MVEEPTLGGVSISEIQQVAEIVGPPTEAGASLATRFARRVSELVAVRAARGDTGHYCIFLQSEALEQDAKRCAHVAVPLLKNGGDPIADRVWLSTASLAHCLELSLQWTDAASLFQAVKDSGLGETPAIVVDWRSGTPQGTLYRRGLQHYEDTTAVAFDDTPITQATLRQVLDNFYERSLRTPALMAEGHAPKVWQDASKGIPMRRPEEIIQGRLLDSLRAAFARHQLRAEPVTDDGRADIVIWKRALSLAGLQAVVNEWILELKALTDRSSTGAAVSSSVTIAAIQSGLEQALGYKTGLNALSAVLCCYDMRAHDVGDLKCFAHVKAEAELNNVPLWRWYIFRTTKASRSARGYLKPVSS